MVTASLPPDELDDVTRSSIVPVDAQRFGRYRLCFELASGGMGKVFLARAEGARGFEKLIALKRIHPHLAERKEFVDMFLDEARITSRIAHPNVCSVFDFGFEGGTYFIAMEYLFGEPLSHVIRESVRRDPDDPFRIPYMARILIDACEGLHAAHELVDQDGRPLDVVHRDVSPHNIFVTYDGGVRVVDFGIAKAEDQLHETHTGAVKGKWAYMSPEQARGRAVDRRGDVWSLGVVLWEAATGRRLFRRPTQTETVLAVVSEPIPPPSDFDPAVPPELDEICLRAMSRDPDERWSSARAMGRALSHYLASRGHPVGLPEVAEWMELIFPGVADRKQSLLRTLAGSEVPRIHQSVETILPNHVMARLENTVADRPARRPRRISRTAAATPRARSEQATGGAEEASPSSGRRAALPPKPPTSRSEADGRLRAVLGGALVIAVALAVWVFSTGEGESDRGAVGSSPTRVPVAATESPSEDSNLVDGADSESSSEVRPAITPTPAEPSSAEPSSAEPSSAEPSSAEPPMVSARSGRDRRSGRRDPSSPTSIAAAERPPTETSELASSTTRREPARPRSSASRAGEQSAPEARPDPEPEPAIGEGMVNLVTTGGWALVFVDGRGLGETPLRVRLPAGEHVLEVRPQGRLPARQVRVRVSAGGRQRLTVPLGE